MRQDSRWYAVKKRLDFTRWPPFILRHCSEPVQPSRATINLKLLGSGIVTTRNIPASATSRWQIVKCSRTVSSSASSLSTGNPADDRRLLSRASGLLIHTRKGSLDSETTHSQLHVNQTAARTDHRPRQLILPGHTRRPAPVVRHSRRRTTLGSHVLYPYLTSSIPLVHMLGCLALALSCLSLHG